MSDEEPSSQLLLPSSMRIKLWDYQEKIVQRLQDGFVNKEYRGMLCCEKMGTGKTVEALATTIGISECEQHAKTDMRLKLVVGPTSVIKSWTDDCSNHFKPAIHTLVVGRCAEKVFTTNSLKTDTIVLVNFQTFIRAYKNALARRIQATNNLLALLGGTYPASDKRITWTRMYLQHLTATSSLWVPTDKDYSDFIANELLDREASLTDFRSVLLNDNLFSIEWEWMIVDEVHEARNYAGCTFAALQSALTHRRLALSATPYNNRISDFMSILDILHAAPEAGWAAALDHGWNVDQLLDFLNQKKQELMIASDSSHAEKMYARFNTQRVAICVPFSTDKEHNDYQKTHARYQQIEQSGGRSVIFEAIPELRKLCDGVTKVNIAQKYSNELLIPYNEKAIYFVWHVKLCEQMVENLKTANRRLLVRKITGDDLPSARTKTLEALKRHQGPAILVTTIQSMSLGVNLPFFQHVVIFTTWWNPMTVAQAKDRIRRPQQERSPRIVEVFIEGTVEKTIDLVSYFKWLFNRQLVHGEITRKMLVPITSKKAMERSLDEMSNNGRATLLDQEMCKSDILREITGKHRGKSTSNKSSSKDKIKGDAVFQHMVFDAESGGNGQRGLLEMIDFFFSSTIDEKTDETSIYKRIWNERCDLFIEDLSCSFSDHIHPSTYIEKITKNSTEPSASYGELAVIRDEKLARKRKRNEGEEYLASRRAELLENEESASKKQLIISKRCNAFGTSRTVEAQYIGLSDAEREVIAKKSVASSSSTKRQVIRLSLENSISR